jgi:pseudouridine-5'-monophosphatase
MVTVQQASKIFHDWAKLPITPEETAAKQSSLQAKYFPLCEPLPGVPALLSKLVSTQSTDQPCHIALATSSNSRNFKLKTDHLSDLFAAFPQVHRVLGDDPRIGKGRGKPLPDIYLLALETINEDLRSKGQTEIKPEECLVFEDAVPGVEAGRRAGMQVVWCPHPGLLEAYKGREEEVLAGLTGAHKEEEKSDAEKEADQLQAGRIQDAGKPGILGDGWGQLYTSLEDFPFARYGIQIP